jgi:hypothetical protein
MQPLWGWPICPKSNTPSQTSKVQAKLVCETVVLLTYQSLYENVSKLVTGGHIGKLNVFCSNPLIQEVVP